MSAAQANIEAVASFVAERLAITRADIAPETRLVEDLGCDGDDADELLIAYAEHFGVDMSNYFFLDFFGWEGAHMIWPFWLHLRCLISRHARETLARGEARLAPLRVWHLAHCAETKTWQHPDHFDQSPRTNAPVGFLRHLLAAGLHLPFVAMFSLVSVGLIVAALVRPTFPWGLVGLLTGCLFLWLLLDSMRIAAAYYADRKKAGTAGSPPLSAR